MSRDLTVADFDGRVGKAVTPKGQHRVLTLADVQRLPRWDGMPREPFLLILHGPPGDVLPEGKYDVELEEGQEFTLYIVPIHTVALERQDYQVAFN